MPRPRPKRKVFHEEDDGDFEILKIDEPKKPESVDGSDSEDEDEVDRLLEDSDSDSDSAPEDVGFLSTKTAALQKAKDAAQLIGLQKTKQKDKRKKLDSLYKEQKKQKLEILEKSRLPDDFLADIADQLPPKSKASKGKSKGQSSGDTEDRLSGSECEDAQEEDVLGEDFIPLSSEPEASIRAVYLQEQLRKPKSSAERAAEFRQRALFRGTIPRESAKSRISQGKKRKQLRQVLRGTTQKKNPVKMC